MQRTRREDPVDKTLRWVSEAPEDDETLLAVISHWRNGGLVVTSVRDFDARTATRGYTIQDDDVEIVLRVAELPFETKRAWFCEQTAALLKPTDDGRLMMDFHRDNILVEAIEQLLAVQMEHIHMPIDAAWISNANERETVPNQEWLALVTAALFDETVGLFRPTKSDATRWTIHPNAHEASADYLLYYRGIGRLFGRALLEGLAIPAHLATLLLKHLLARPLSLADVQEVDANVYASLETILKTPDSLDFSVTHGETVVALKDDGAAIPVTNANKREYVELVLQHVVLGQVAAPLEALIAGVFEVIPQEIVLPFTPHEFDQILTKPRAVEVVPDPTAEL